MKITFITVFFLTLTTVTLAQKTALTVTESPEFKDTEKAKDVLAIHTNKANETVVLRSSKRNFMFDVFDAELNKIHSDIIKSTKKEKYIGFVAYKNVLNFITVLSPKKKERIVYCHTLDIFKKTHQKKKLFDTTVEKNQPIFSGSNKRETNMAISPNGKYLVVATDNIKKNSNAYKVHIYNTEDFSLKYVKNFQEHKEKFYQANDLIIDDDANVFALGKLYKEGKSDKKSNKANYQFVLTKISDKNTSTLDISLKDGLFIQSLVLNNYSKNFQAIGFYSNSKSGRIKGGCNFEINPQTMTLINSKNTELPKQVYEDLYGYRKAKKKKKKGKELKRFYVDYVIEDTKGRTYLLAEEFYVTHQYVPNGMGGGYTRTIYHYDDILIMKFDSNGNLEWGRSIYKKSTAPSYNVFLKNDKLHVILNSGKNLLDKKDGRTKVSKGWFESSSLYDFEYNSAGKVSYNKIQDNKGKTFYLPYNGTFENDIFIMMSSGRKKRQFMKLE